MTYSTIFFDLDDTLYPRSSGLWPSIGRRIDLFMNERLNIPTAEIPVLRQSLFIKYGTTMRGLQAHYDIDTSEYLDFVHDVPLNKYIGPNPILRKTLLDTPLRKFVFTNADLNHANRVLAVLGIADLFEGIIDILTVSPFCKPMPKAFEIALATANEIPQKCILVDDSLANLDAAKTLGIFTIHISENHSSSDGKHTSIHDLVELRDLIPAVLGRYEK